MNNLKEMKPSEAKNTFYSLKEAVGEGHWPKIFQELTEQGLPTTWQILSLKDQVRDVAEIDALTQGLNQKETDLMEGLGTASKIKEDILDPIEDGLREHMVNWEIGRGPDAIAETRAWGQAAKNAALVHYRKNRDAAAAVAFGVGIISNSINAINTETVHALVPAEYAHISDADIEDAAAGAQIKDVIKAFQPVPPSFAHQDPELDELPRRGEAAKELFDSLQLHRPVP